MAELDSNNSLVVIKVSATKQKSFLENGSGGDYHAAKTEVRNLHKMKSNDEISIKCKADQFTHYFCGININ